MKQSELTRAQTWTILGGAAVMLSLAMGMRQSWGLFQPHMIREIGITAADFSLAIAIQNIVWGITQPFVGILADRHGVRPVALFGVAIYGIGIVLSIFSHSALVFTLGAGLCIGIALSCTASNIAMNVTARTASAAKRMVAMGSVSAIGSLGLTFASPLAQTMAGRRGHRDSRGPVPDDDEHPAFAAHARRALRRGTRVARPVCGTTSAPAASWRS